MPSFSSYVLSIFAAATAVVEGQSTWPAQSFKTEPFTPPVFAITTNGKALAPGYLFYTPSITNTSAAINIASDTGELIWSSANMVPTASDAKQQTLYGEPVLTYWNGSGTPAAALTAGHGAGAVYILNSNYTVQKVICPDLGLVFSGGAKPPCQVDLHEQYITTDNSIIVTAYNVTTADLSDVPGFVGKTGYVFDCLFYEIDIATGDILFQWSALKAGLKPADSFAALHAGANGTEAFPFDFFHINSVKPMYGGYVISSRNFWSILKINLDGSVKMTFRGDDGGDFSLPKGANFAWQHDAQVYNRTKKNIVLSFFDDANTPAPNGAGVNQTLGREFLLDFTTNKTTVLKAVYDPKDPLYAQQQGSYGALSNGNVLMGYGAVAAIKEFGPTGNTDVRLSIQFGIEAGAGKGSYRTYKQTWYSVPAADPVAVVKSGYAYFSWNGATNVTSWEIYEGKTAATLAKTKSVVKSGFETNTTIPSTAAYVQVQAYNGKTAMRKSNVVKV